IGKWHLDGHPLDCGFDHFFGFLNGFADHFAGSKYFQLDREPFTAFGPDYYSSDAFTDRAIEFIQAPESSTAPFFLYLSFQAPHNPLQAPRAEILQQRGRYRKGWQAIRAARFQRQKEIGIVSTQARLPDYPQNLPDWNTLTAEQRDLEDLRMSVYAAMVEHIDASIGRVMQALEDSGQGDNTLILFMSDNGTDSFSVMDKALLKQGKLPGDPGSNYQPGTGWAYASVTPWRLYKISQHGGGVTTGAIAWWPGAQGSPGRIEHRPLHMIDLFPTLLEAARQSPPEIEVAGESFLSLLHGQSWQRQGSLYFQFMDNRALRDPEWSLVEVDNAGWELFRIGSDPLENRDLAHEHPDVVADLQSRWQTWWHQQSGESGYVPKSTKTGPHYKPQGDRGSGVLYVPSAMPLNLADRYPVSNER
ncbi:sulfatase-like hydrolase/transferase, partial [Planctomycetota bacterium]